VIKCPKSLSFICLALALSVASTAIAQPPTVPRKTVRQLDEASYVELAKQWKAYIAKQGESATAMLNLGRAYDYSGEMDAAVAAAKRAVELDPDHPEALAFYAMEMASWGNDVEGSIELLEHCRKVAPDYGYGLTNLATSYMRLGDFEKSDEVFKTIFKERTIPQPLQDYAYNMLVGLPEGAILVTHGDNDTFSPLALQAGMGFRTDVALINLSLLNVEKYREAVFKRYPAITPKKKVPEEYSRPPHQIVIEYMLEEHKVPIFFTAINFEYVGSSPDLFVEGFNQRAVKRGLTTEESARLILETYRMDSATDWNFAWSLQPSTAEMMLNYVSAMVRLSEYEDISKETRRKLLEKALEISKFHDFTKLTIYVKKSLQKP
jgi:tetratricopeptide (TPR) repeat protein